MVNFRSFGVRSRHRGGCNRRRGRARSSCLPNDFRERFALVDDVGEIRSRHARRLACNCRQIHISGQHQPFGMQPQDSFATRMSGRSMAT